MTVNTGDACHNSGDSSLFCDMARVVLRRPHLPSNAVPQWTLLFREVSIRHKVGGDAKESSLWGSPRGNDGVLPGLTGARPGSRGGGWQWRSLTSGPSLGHGPKQECMVRRYLLLRRSNAGKVGGGETEGEAISALSCSWALQELP